MDSCLRIRFFLEKKKKMYEKMYKKLTKEDYQAPIVDEELDTEATPEA